MFVGWVANAKAAKAVQAKRGWVEFRIAADWIASQRAEYILELNFFSADFLPASRLKMDVEKPSVGLTANTTSSTPLQRLNCILCKNYIGGQTETISFFGPEGFFWSGHVSSALWSDVVKAY